ncbi:UNVERIFIED_CONTAM: hypothetical protein NCL1_15756 [Trichonephila clavipes]
MNPGSVYSIKMVASMFGGIVVNEHWQRAFFFVILTHHLAARYISGVLRPVDLHFIRALRNPTFQQDNARPHVARIVQTFLDTENVKLFPLPACSPDFSPIKTSGSWFPSDWLVTIRQSLLSMSCDIVLELHGYLYLYMPSSVCLTQCLGVQVLLLLPEVVVLGTVSQDLCTQIS